MTDKTTLAIRRRLLVAGLVVAVLVTTASVWTVRNQKPLPPLPKPNGFHHFVVAGRMVQLPFRIISDATPEEWRQTVQTNAAVLSLVRQGLLHESKIPHPSGTNYIDIRVGETMAARDVERVFRAAGMLAVHEERYLDAADTAAELVRFGHEAFRGGVMIDRLIGIAVEHNGLELMETLTNKLDAAGCRELAARLEEVDRARETSAEVLANEAEWSRKGTTVRQRIEHWFSPLRGIGEEAVAGFLTRMDDHDRKRRRLILHFAARTYELEQGRKPARASELVPEYLEAVPKDPETGADMPLP
jgi:hypothetical protein